ncbi:C1GALT1-specific chaperone 1 [Amblyraja radiata]|uniref:C1GALT1-specific chaperone 1 n=1 Tax=Amblyraja radiata TaxID=386614 RepID=UPI001403071D|nr:C1GALT1-specific chaperone 1 [Amblyraja radiata]XP_032886583.1 C1GALT1-specific chaperone 1 [Amblyraja radiata]
MIKESIPFLKGILLGGVFCLFLTLINNTKIGGQMPYGYHQHHHIKAPNKDELNILSEAMRMELTQSIRVLCLIMVKPKEIGYWASVVETWSKHCDKAVFYSSETIKPFESVGLGTEDQWIKTRKAFKNVYENYKDDYGWFFLVQSSTFAIIENLKFFLLNKDPKEPFYIGHTVKSGDLDYVEMSSGVVLSAEALTRLNLVLDDPDKCPEKGNLLWKMSEEKELAVCLKYKGVFAENAEDNEGKELFNSKNIKTLIEESMSNHKNEVVEGCCSDVAITFHGGSPNHMHVMMYGVYRLRPYGHAFNDALIFNPPAGSIND